MKYFLDSNVCVYFLKANFPPLRRRLLSHRPAEIVIPSLVKAELLYGAYKSQRTAQNEQAVLEFLLPYSIAAFGDPEASHYAHIRAVLEKSGTPIGPNAMIIAAIARANEGTLVTHNVSEFSRVPDLSIEDWTHDQGDGAP